MITFTEISSCLWQAVFENGIFVGEAVQDVDGYFYFWFQPLLVGAHPAHLLRQIADTLDELNEPWDKIVQAEIIA